MKTTSYELSKKLAEIGFKREHDQYFAWNSEEGDVLHRNYFEHNRARYEYPSYDLETILEALPKEIERDNGFNIGLRFWWADGASWIGYQNFSGFIITVDANQSESLADTAARLLILLHEKGIINFNEGIK
jgi:hypothetical protein